MRTIFPIKLSKTGQEPRRWKWPRLGVRGEGLEGRLRSSFMDAMREYLQVSTLGGVKYASHADVIKSFRRIYLFLLAALMLFGLTVLGIFNYNYHTRPPLQVQIVPDPGIIVNFPAVAICSNSIVSKKELAKYAVYLEKTSNNDTYDLKKIEENLAKFGSLITLRTSDVEMLNFMQFLYNIDPDYNITDIMYSLSPKCSSMLGLCRWRGRQLPCEQLFATRLTPLGYCCIFNSRYLPEDVDNPPKVLDLVGMNYGLAVAVYQDSGDFAVVRQPATHALAVLLFDGNEYPLLEGGAVRGYNVGVNASVFFQLTAEAQFATEALRAYKPEKRQCRLQQVSGPKSWLSSYSWCLAMCRRDCTVAICDCQPFWYGVPSDAPVCTPEHLYCLNKHREKFIYYYPGDDVHEESLAEEIQDSLDCMECLPDCARALHHAKVFHPIYYFPNKIFTNYARPFTEREISLVNKSYLRFFYDSMSHHAYRVDLNYFWYDAVATTSCQSLFLVGLSLISVAELLFHFTLRWGHHFIQRTREEMRRRRFAFFG